MPFSLTVDNPTKLACSNSALSHAEFAQPDNLAVVTRLPSLSRNTLLIELFKQGL